jgi:hypothetical protein
VKDATPDQKKIIRFFKLRGYEAKPRTWAMGVTVMITDLVGEEEDALGIRVLNKLAYAMRDGDDWVIWHSQMGCGPDERFPKFKPAMRALLDYLEAEEA